MATKFSEQARSRRSSSLSALNPLFTSKTRAPLPPRPYLARPRLLNQLRHLTRRRVTLVCAPAGAGKTTLLADFIRPQAQSASWYTVDDLDENATAFLHGLSLAVGCASSRPLDQRGYLAQIVEMLGEGAARKRLIVDDVHRLIEPSAEQALCDLVRYLPPAARLILIGRNAPAGISSVLDWLAAQNQLAQLTWDDFKLSGDERRQASGVFKTTSSGAWILGWAHPEGLDLARYLRTEVLAPLGPKTTERLARLSVLPSFDPALSAAVLGCAEGEAWELLNRIQRETPLLERRGDDAYRFTETARDILGRALPPDELDVARQAAGLALRDVDPKQSAECFLAAGDSRAAAESLASLPLSEWLTQAATPIHALLRQISTEDLRGHPRLVLAHAWAMIAWRGETDNAIAALAQLEIPSNDLELRFWCLYVTARGFVALGRTESLRAAYTAIVEILDQIRRSPSVSSATTAGMLCRVAMVERYLGDDCRAVATAENGLLLAELCQAATAVERRLLHQTLGTFKIWDGDYQAADQHLGAALTLSDGAADLAQRATIWHAQAGVARCRGEFIRALSLLEQGLRESLVPPREQMLLNLQAAHALADVQDFRGAAKRYRSVASMLRQGDRDGCFSRALSGLAICYSFLGLGAEADAPLSQLRKLDRDRARYDLLLAEGVLALQRDDPMTAAARFAQASQDAVTLGGFQDRWQAVLLKAQAVLRQNNRALAEKVIEDFLDAHPDRPLPAVGLWVLRPVHLVLSAVYQRRPDTSIAALLKLAAADPTAPKLRHAVAAIDQATQTESRASKIHVFGPPRLVVDGAPVAWPYGLRHKSIELFWYAALHPDGFTRDQALNDLFADRDTVSGVRLFQVAVSNLRTALSNLLGVPGAELLVRDPDGSFRLRTDARPESQRANAGRFDDGRSEAVAEHVAPPITIETHELASLAEELRTNRRMRLPSDVPDLFRGELLAGMNAEWIEPIRRYWTAVYLRTLGALANRYARLGLLQQAISCRERALQVDPTLEAAHADLMRLYHAAGDRQAVESQMWLYTRVIREELDAEPTEEVEELYRRLVTTVNPL